MDPRPENCRFRLEEEGKPRPRSGCQGCGKGLFAIGEKCHIPVPSPADTIETQAARIEELERERDEALAAADRVAADRAKIWRNAVDALTARAESAEAEVKRLREALCAAAQAAGGMVSPEASIEFMEMIPIEIALRIRKVQAERDIARAALKEAADG